MKIWRLCTTKLKWNNKGITVRDIEPEPVTATHYGGSIVKKCVFFTPAQGRCSERSKERDIRFTSVLLILRMNGALSPSRVTSLMAWSLSLFSRSDNFSSSHFWHAVLRRRWPARTSNTACSCRSLVLFVCTDSCRQLMSPPSFIPELKVVNFN